MICLSVERGIPVTVKMAAAVAVVLSAIGIGMFYASGLILSALPPTMPSFARFLLWFALALVGIFLILGGVLTFYATYITNRKQMNRHGQREDNGQSCGR